MKKERKVLNRILSLLLCLVMASGMFTGLGMEVSAADYKIVLYKATSGITFTDGTWIDKDIDMKIYDKDGNHEMIQWKAGTGATTSLDNIARIEFFPNNQYFKSDGIELVNYYIHPDYNTHYQHSIIVWPACKLNITVVDHQNNPIPNQPVKVSWGGTDYGTVTTNAQGKATHWNVRKVASGVTVSTQYEGYTHSVETGYLGDEYDITLKTRKLQNATLNLKNANGDLLKNGSVYCDGASFKDNDNDGTYTAVVEVGKSYTIGASVLGYDEKAAEGVVFSESKNSHDITLDATLPASIPDVSDISLSVGEKYRIFLFSLVPPQGVTYSAEIENSDIASYDGSDVLGLKAGQTNLCMNAIVGNVKRTRKIPITVVKADPTVSVTAPTNVIYGKYEGDFTLKSNVAGTFTINGKEIAVSANTNATESFVNIVTESQEVGSYDLTWTFSPAEADKYNSKTGSVQYHIGTRDLSIDGKLDYDTPNFVYDGTAKTLTGVEVSADGKLLQPGVDYTVDYKNNVKAGNDATVEVTGKGNYTGTISEAFNIAKAKLSVANVTADNRTYDGTKMVQISGVELNNIATGDKLSDIIDFAGATAMISDKDAGEYVFVNNLSGISLKDTENYEFTIPATEVALKDSVIISPAKVKIVDVAIEPTKIYDGSTTVNITDKGIVSGVITGDEVVVVKGTARYEDKNVGNEKRVTFSDFSIMGGLETVISNYELAEQPSSQTASITKKSLYMKDGSANVKDKLYDGTTATEFSTTPELVQTDLIENDKVTIDAIAAPVFNEIGSADEERSVEVTTNLIISGEDAGNYNLQIPEVVAMIKNYTAARGKDYSVNSNEWNNEDFVITAGDGCLISDGSLLESVWTDKLVVNCEDNNSNVGTKAFYVKNANGEISRVVNDKNAEYKIDKIAPTGTVTFTDAQTPWIEFIKTISFGLFYKDAQEVVITSQDQDGLSGVASVEWYESLNKGMTLEEVETITNWKEYKGNLIVALEDTKKFVYYVKITDNAGNVTYLSTDGAVYDITNPAITGVVNGETYYTSQRVNVSDVNLEAVKFNGETLKITDGKVEPIKLEGNVERTYTIVATDKAGNTTEVTVIMKTISSLSDQLADITEENVTSDAAESIDEIQKIIADENQSNATEEEKKLLKELLEKCGNLEKTLEAAKEVVNDAKEVVNKVTEGNVTLNEVTELKKAKDNLESILAKNKGNLTAKEKEEIQKTIADLDAIIEVIDEVKDAAKAIKAAKSADGEYGVPDNEAAVSAYERAKDAYDRLTEEQKAMLGSDVKKALKEAKAAITNYKIIEGDGKIWVHNTNGTVTFVGNGLVRKLKNVIIDGKVFSSENYHVSKGSTVVEVEAAALYRLGLGDHTFQMEYEDGKTDVVEFSIVTMEEWNAMSNQQTGSNKTGGVATGDSANILLWGTALAVGAAGLVVANKKRKDKKA